VKSRKTLAARLAAALLACAVSAPARAADPAAVVDALRWQGVRGVSEAELEARVFTRARPWWQPFEPKPGFQEEMLEGDMARVADLYREHGYYETRASYTLEWNAPHDAVTVHIAVEEGARVTLAGWSVALDELAWRGGEARWRKLLVDPLPLKAGEVFTIDAYGGAKRALLGRLADQGFPDATLAGGGEVDLATHTATIAWTVHPGARVRVGPIAIEGLGDVREDVVRRALAIEEGQLWSDAKLRRSQRQISELGLFRAVTITPTLPPETPAPGAPVPRVVTRPLTVRLEPRPLRSVRLGVGYGTEDRVRVQAGWLHRNVLGRADQFDVHGRYSTLGSEFEASLREPQIPDPRTTLWLDSRLRDETVPAYTATSLRNQVAVERPLRLGWSGRVAYDLEWQHVRTVPTAAFSELRDPERKLLLSSVELGARRVTVDDITDPTRGTWLEANLEGGARWIGSDESYARFSFDARGFLPLGPTVLAARTTLGSIVGLERTQRADLPITKLFYLGGSSNLRGFDFQHLGTDGKLGNPLGGDSVLAGTLELRFPVWRALTGAVFGDAGQLSRRPWAWAPNKLQYSLGTGLRYKTPLGPVRADLAFPLDPPQGVSRVRVWLSIGQSF
jgi:outer membrane protein assembly complex protein YaeT